jgi:iron complex outermembrane receptor protein
VKFHLGTIILFSCIIGTSAFAQTDPSSDLTAISLEELLNTKVTSVSRRQQSISDSAAAVSVLTSEDIRRSGASSIPELLRHVIGLDVARVNGTNWAVSSRGFNSFFADKMLVLVDGRIVYNPIFGGVFWDEVDTMLEDVDRIEVIRGPGASVWGGNAVNGVINIITKKTADTQGGLLVASGGNVERGNGAGRYGGTIGKKTQYRIFAKYSDLNSDGSGPGPNRSDLSMLRGGLRVESQLDSENKVTISGESYSGQDNSVWTEGVIGQPVPQPYQNPINVAGGFVLGEWDHAFRNGSDSLLRFSYEKPKRTGLDLTSYDVEFQHNFSVGSRQQISWGFGYRYTTDTTAVTGRGFKFVPASDTTSLGNGFVEDTFAFLGSRLKLSVGGKIERSDFSNWELQPRISGIFKLNRRHSVWAAVSRANETTSRTDRAIQADVVGLAPNPLPGLVRAMGNPNLKAERVAAYEAGYRWEPLKRVSVDAATFYNRYSDLVGQLPGTPSVQQVPTLYVLVPTISTNEFSGPSYGGEIQSHWILSDRWRLNVNYAFLRVSLKAPATGSQVGPANADSPRHTFLIDSSFQLNRRIETNLFLRAMSSAPDANAPAYAQLGARIGWHLSESSELSLNGEDLLHQARPEFSPAQILVAGVVGRSISAKLTWHF